MAIKYYVANNTGRGFITHEDNESSLVAGYPGDIYATENTTWASRVRSRKDLRRSTSNSKYCTFSFYS